ncbi:hypothetical protein [Kitasatospora griseola]|uniref:hypothetical protein n=1 Tax=Kitasatospora griseola TaxID=2064 RepID=UPI00166FFB0D|nr:hypothetical protein [Kitasatospora griseola]GGQ50127.1 hypothetical protein GCM10010195_01240 [Kitasatospora griseola]
MKKLWRVYLLLAATAAAGMALLSLPELLADKGCDAAVGRADSEQARQLLAAHPDSVADGRSSKACNVDGGFGHAETEYQYAVPETDIVAFYQKHATSIGWAADDEGATGHPENVGFCFTGTVSDRPVLIRVSFRKPEHTYVVKAESSLKDEKPGRCWVS